MHVLRTTTNLLLTCSLLLRVALEHIVIYCDHVDSLLFVLIVADERVNFWLSKKVSLAL